MSPEGDTWAENRLMVLAAIKRLDGVVDDLSDAVISLKTSVAEIKASNRTWALVVSLVVAAASVLQVVLR